MINLLKGRKIAIAVTGSIAAYKVFEIIRLLKHHQAEVLPILTKNACSFVTPLSVEIACGNRALVDLFEAPLEHIELAKRVELFLVAPATANFINKFAAGIADDLLSTTVLAFRGPIVVAPAMNWRLYESPQVKRSIEYLKSLGVVFVEPEEGSLACGEEGKGRLASADRILFSLMGALVEKDLAGKKFLITAGPTREYIDPIRFITNKSSGKMGFALAKVAKLRGAEVTLISGPTHLNPPPVDLYISVETTEDMLRQVLRNLEGKDALIMAAAPLDFKPNEFIGRKLSKNSISSIQLTLCPDILMEVKKIERRPITVGFSAEWGFDRARAIEKLNKKGLDMIVLNDISEDTNAMASDLNKVVIIYRVNNRTVEESTELMAKEAVAEQIISKVAEIVSAERA